MDNTLSIPIDRLCKHYDISRDFMEGLYEYGIIVLHPVQEVYCLSEDQLHILEKYIHFHTELDINLEGLQVVHQLLNRIEYLERQLEMIRKGSLT